jgi:uncharacterized delta-60 repeat protein
LPPLRSRCQPIVLLGFLALLAAAPSAQAAPADLDPSFGAGGRVVTDVGPGRAVAGLALQADGKLVVAGTAGEDFVIVRYRPDGSLDPSFDGDGIVRTDQGDFDDAEGVAIDASGRIVLAGDNENGSVLVRYESDGSLDDDFGNGGVVVEDFGGQVGVTDVAIQADGKILLQGVTEFLLARFDADGRLDGGFSGDGVATTDFGGVFDEAGALAIQPDGKIVVVGGTGDDLDAFDFALARLNADGTPDAGFSGDGVTTTDFGSPPGGVADFDDFAEDVLVQPDGKLVAAGGRFQLARYGADGELDPAFGSGGKQETDFGGGQFATSLALPASGRLVAAGGAGDFAVARYGPDGLLDPSFGAGGTQTTPFAGGVSAAIAVVAQADGKLVLAGNGPGGFALARYQGDAAPAGPPTPPPSGGSPAPAPPHVAAPAVPPLLRLSLVRLTRSGRRRAVGFQLSLPARVTLTIFQARGGVRRGHRCLAPKAPKAAKAGRRCDLRIKQLTRSFGAGGHAIVLPKRLGTGRHRLVLAARTGRQITRVSLRLP